MLNFQKEHAKWLATSYTNQMPKIPAMGCLEEAGELVHAVLKLEQIRIWGETERHKLPELQAKLVDAVGDCGIYACSLCTANNWDFTDIWWRTETQECSNIIDAVILLANVASYVAMFPSEYDRLFSYVSQLKTIAKGLGLDAEATILTTWETVKCR